VNRSDLELIRGVHDPRVHIVRTVILSSSTAA
jgi:hypothetical protein